jgi:hypothetical protein
MDRPQLTEQRRSQSHIVALLEHISEGLERAKNLPSREAAEEAKEASNLQNPCYTFQRK